MKMKIATTEKTLIGHRPVVIDYVTCKNRRVGPSITTEKEAYDFATKVADKENKNG